MFFLAKIEHVQKTTLPKLLKNLESINLPFCYLQQSGLTWAGGGSVSHDNSHLMQSLPLDHVFRKKQPTKLSEEDFLNYIFQKIGKNNERYRKNPLIGERLKSHLI